MISSTPPAPSPLRLVHIHLYNAFTCFHRDQKGAYKGHLCISPNVSSCSPIFQFSCLPIFPSHACLLSLGMPFCLSAIFFSLFLLISACIFSPSVHISLCFSLSSFLSVCLFIFFISLTLCLPSSPSLPNVHESFSFPICPSSFPAACPDCL